MANENYFRVSSLPVGSQIKFGKNKFTGKYQDGEEDIVWVVLSHNHHLNDDGYPQNATTLIARNVLRYMAFDAKESLNTIQNRKDYGNSRYRTSNIRQWLNSEGFAGQWFTPQNIGTSGSDNKDATPNATNILNVSRNYPYDTDEGFMRYFSEMERNTLLPTNVKTIKSPSSEGSNVNVPALEITSDYFYLPSLIEITGSTFNYGAIAPTEGGKILQSGNTIRNAKASYLSLLNSSFYNEDPMTDKNYIFRSPATNDEILRYADNGTTGTFLRVKPFENLGIRPMTNMKSDTVVVQDSEGFYILVDNAKPYVVIQSVLNFEMNYKLYDYDDALESMSIEINSEQVFTKSFGSLRSEEEGVYQIPFNKLVFGNNTVVIRVNDSRAEQGIKTLNVQLSHKDPIAVGDTISTESGLYTISNTSLNGTGQTVLTLNRNLTQQLFTQDVVEIYKTKYIPYTFFNNEYTSLPVYTAMNLKSIDYNRLEMKATEEWELVGLGNHAHTKVEMEKPSGDNEAELEKISQIFTYYED